MLESNYKKFNIPVNYLFKYRKQDRKFNFISKLYFKRTTLSFFKLPSFNNSISILRQTNEYLFKKRLKAYNN